MRVYKTYWLASRANSDSSIFLIGGPTRRVFIVPDGQLRSVVLKKSAAEVVEFAVTTWVPGGVQKAETVTIDLKSGWPYATVAPYTFSVGSD